MLIGYLKYKVFSCIVHEIKVTVIKITHIVYQVIIDDVIYGHTDRFCPLPNISTTGVIHYLDTEEIYNYDPDNETFLTSTNTENT